jgi:hypothetical protein
MKAFFNWFKPKQKGTVVLEARPIKSSFWRNNMWVMTPDGIGIIFDLRQPVLVHLVDERTGLTIGAKEYLAETIRQAKYKEIPESRRGSPEKAARLGYE